MNFLKAKKFILVLLFIFSLTTIFYNSVIVKADTGPKPFIDITFENIEYDEYYVTLLIKRESYSMGPWVHLTNEQIEEKDYETLKEYGYDEIGLKLNSYIDKDGYLYYGYYNKLTKDKNNFLWGYYAPKEFKILIYVNESNEFICIDNVINTYAFNSYFNLKYVNSSESIITKTYNYSKEVWNCILRIVLTLVIELGIALLFRYRGKGLLIILITNIFTQVLLNVLLNINIYNHGGGIDLIVLFVYAEILIFIVEGLCYSLVLPIFINNEKIKHIRLWGLLYGFVANIASVILGAIILW